MFSYENIFALALVVSAFLALHFENIYAVISFGAMFAVLSAFYFSLNAQFAAVFQLAVAVGTIAVFFLAGQMLTPKKRESQKLRNKIWGIMLALCLSVPSIVFSFETEMSMRPQGLSFPSALWEFRALDVIAQGVVVLTLALGVVMVLKGRRKQVNE